MAASQLPLELKNFPQVESLVDVFSGTVLKTKNECVRPIPDVYDVSAKMMSSETCCAKIGSFTY